MIRPLIYVYLYVSIFERTVAWWYIYISWRLFIWDYSSQLISVTLTALPFCLMLSPWYLLQQRQWQEAITKQTLKYKSYRKYNTLCTLQLTFLKISDYIYLHVYKPIQAHMDLMTNKLKLHLNNFFQLLSHLLMKLNQKSSMFLLSSTPTCECLCGALSTMITFCLHVNNLCLCTFSLPNVIHCRWWELIPAEG